MKKRFVAKPFKEGDKGYTKKEYVKKQLIELFDNTNDEEAIKEIDSFLEEVYSENDLNLVLALIHGGKIKETSKEFENKRQEVFVTLAYIHLVMSCIKDIPF